MISGLVEGDVKWWKVVPRPCCCRRQASKETAASPVGRFVRSHRFRVGMTLFIMLNILYVCFDELFSKGDICWLVVEAIFCFVVFLMLKC